MNTMKIKTSEMTGAAPEAPQLAIPPGYKLVPIQKLVELKASIHGDYYRGEEWELETISTMLIEAAHGIGEKT